MATSNLQQFPKPFPESNPLHLYRTAEVVIVKRLRAFTLPGMAEDEPEVKGFQRDFFEFLGGSGLLIPCKPLDVKWANPDLAVTPVGPIQPGAVVPLYNHYFISATAVPGATVNTVSAPAKGNADVITVKATVNTEGRGSCTVVLASPQDKYVFKRNPFRYGQAVVEPNDMIFVTLPGLDGVMRRVFTGLVSHVQVQKVLGDTLKTSVVLDCEDMLKPLTQSRTAVKPSLTPGMSDGKQFAGFENDFSDRLPHDIMSEILALAYSDFFTVKGFYDNLAQARSNLDDTQAQVDEFQLLKSLTALPQPSSTTPGTPPSISFDPSKPFLATAGSAAPTGSVVASITPFDPQAASRQTATQIPSKVYGFRRARRDAEQASTAVDKALKGYAPLQIADMDDMAFVISGTSQPGFQLAFGSPSMYFADYKSGLALCRQIADDLTYEFFANQNGVVLFRPLNVSLPANFINGAKPIPTAKLKTANGRVGSEYWLDDKLVSGQPTFVDSDVDVFTFAYVGSDRQITTGSNEIIKGSAFDFFKFLKYGARTAPVVTRLSLLTDEACNIYASAYLSRLNSSFSSASITYTGDARIQAGNPCFVQSRNTVYYIAAVTHNFTAGQSYTVDLTLKYGRRPVAVTPGTLLSTAAMTDLGLKNFLQSKALAKVLFKLREGAADTLARFIEDNEADLTFQGYIWEPLMPFDYESLYASLKEQGSFNFAKETAENSRHSSPIYKEKKVAVQQAAAKQSKPIPVGQPLEDAVIRSLALTYGVNLWNPTTQ